MMIRSQHVIASLVLLGLLTGCGTSPPTHYYVLSAQTGTVPLGSGPALGVGPVSVPEYLNRNNLITNREGHSLAVAAFDRWAEPLVNGIERVLAINLAGLVGTQNIRLYPWNEDQLPDYGVRISVLRLDASGDQANLSAEWLVYRPQSKAQVARKLSHLQQPLSGGSVSAEDIAETYSELLYQLSEIIAGTITSDNTEKDTN